MAILVASTGWSTECRLQRETIYQVELTPHYHSCGGFSSLLDNEVAAIETEVLRVFTKEKWINALFQAICLLVWAAIHEEIFGSRVTMIVAVK